MMGDDLHTVPLH